MWVGGMPVADTPLWQLAQLLVTPRWLNIAPPQVRVVWQASHSRSVTMCVGPLPCAMTPLWQVEQLPRTWGWAELTARLPAMGGRESTRLNSSHGYISYARFCLEKKKTE